MVHRSFYCYRCFQCLHIISDQGPIKVSYFWSTSIDPDTSQPDHVGYMDMLVGIRGLGREHTIKEQTYFVAPDTGQFKFFSCPKFGIKVYLSTDASDSNKQSVLDVSSGSCTDPS